MTLLDKCFICEHKLLEAEELTYIPPLISNVLDPLFEFSETIVHSNCLLGHKHNKILNIHIKANEEKRKYVEEVIELENIASEKSGAFYCC